MSGLTSGAIGSQIRGCARTDESRRNTEQALAELQRALDGRVTSSESRTIAYGRDWSLRLATVSYPPDIVAMPESTEEVQAIIKIARRLRIPVVPFAGGTGAAGGAVAIHGGIAVDLKRLSTITEVDRRNFTVTCGAGTVVLTLTKELERAGFWLPQQTESKIAATVGGGINCGSRATFGIRYGDWQDTLLDALVVTGAGDIVRLGHRKAARSATGYNLLRLFVGSEGTLGIVTEVTLRIHRMPANRKITAFIFRSVQDAASGLQHLMTSGLAVEGGNINCRKRLATYTHSYREKYGRPPEIPDWGKAILFVTFAGDSEIVNMTEHAATKVLRREFDAVAFDDHEMLESWWSVKHSLDFIAYHQKWPDSQREKKHCVADLGIPLGRIGEAYEEFLRIADAIGLDILGMNVYNQACNRVAPSVSFTVSVDDTDANQVESFHQYLCEMSELALRMEGTLSSAIGDGDRLLELNAREHGSALSYMAGVKRAFDPDWIMNPGKKLPLAV